MNEIRKLIDGIEARAERQLSEHRAALEGLAEALLARETVEADEIERIFTQAGAEAGPAGEPTEADGGTQRRPPSLKLRRS